MSEPKVYDRVRWHYPEGAGCPDLDAATRHFRVALDWLGSRGLLTAQGRAVDPEDLDPDFALTDELLTERGQVLLDRVYRRWLDDLDYDRAPTTELLDRAFLA